MPRGEPHSTLNVPKITNLVAIGGPAGAEGDYATEGCNRGICQGLQGTGLSWFYTEGERIVEGPHWYRLACALVRARTSRIIGFVCNHRLIIDHLESGGGFFK